MLIVRPLGGLCNRLRTIESAHALALQAGLKLKVIWDIDNHSLHAPFASLFLPIEGVIIKENYIDTRLKKIFFMIEKFFQLLSIHTYISQKFLYKTIEEKWDSERSKVFFEDHAHRGSLWVECCWDFYPIKRSYKLFKPVYAIQKEIDDYSKKISTETIGIHIRRTDHVTAITESPIELFVVRMNQLISENDRVNFFLATDSKEVETQLCELFKNKMLTYSQSKSRVSELGVQQAVIDLFLLSKTQKILGSFWSSYSMGASELGNIELEIVTKKNL